MTSGASPARRSASSAVRATSTPSGWNAGSLVSTMLVRPGSGLPIESYVRRPMIIGFPIVTVRTFFMSSGRRQGRPPSLPMTLLRSNATTNAIRPTRASDRHLRFDRWMELVLLEPRDRIEERARLLARPRAQHDLAVARDHVVEIAQRRIEREARRRERLAPAPPLRRGLGVARASPDRPVG